MEVLRDCVRFGSLACFLSLVFVLATCLTCLAACGADTVPTEGSLLLSTESPSNVEEQCCGPNVATVGYSVSCIPTHADALTVDGELEVVEEDIGLVPGDGTTSWQGFLDGLPPATCDVTLTAVDFAGEVYCVATATVPIEAGQVAEETIPLICTLSWGPRPDLTEEEVRACIDAGAACF